MNFPAALTREREWSLCARSASDVVSIFADRQYRQSEQVFITYGPKSNSDLLLFYGFALSRNPFNSIELAVGVPESDPLFQSKATAARRMSGKFSGAGADRTGVAWEKGPAFDPQDAPRAAFPIYADRFPEELLAFLRMAVLKPDDAVKLGGSEALANRLTFDLKLSEGNERDALLTIASACESAIRRYDTTAEDDDKLLDDRRMMSVLGWNARMAIKVRRGEKVLLRKTAEISRARANLE